MFLCMSMNAQTLVKGDMNDDGDVNIADVTTTVDVILGKKAKETISLSVDPFKVDNSTVVGTWVAPDNSSFPLNEDGTTTFPGAATYKFRPVQGVLTFYDASDNPIRAIVLNEVTSDYLMAVDYTTNTFTKYTKQGDQPEIPDTHEYVDLVLPSGTLWATCNIGANSPEEYGDHFAWGETTGYNDGKTVFSWNTYKWCKGSSETLIKYCTKSEYGNNGFTDGKTVLDLEDDAARANWGGDWRMPTLAEIEELMNNTTREWTTLNGVNGYKFSSKSNGNSIFLPAAGYRWYGALDDVSSVGAYLSSTIDESVPSDPWFLYFTKRDFYMNTFTRAYGYSIRPVR